MASSAKPVPASSFWLQTPALDFIVGCGAWSAPLLALAYFTSASQTAAWSIAFYGLALFFNYPHYVATIYRAFHDAENFRKYRFFTVYVTGAFAVLLVLCHAYPRLLPLIFTLYLTWSPWHYSGQNYGILAMFARRAGAAPSPATRRYLYFSFVASYAVLFLALHTGVSTDPLFVSLNLPESWSRPALAGLALAFLALAIAGCGGLRQQLELRTLAAPVILLSTQFLWFVLPSLLHLVSGFTIPQGRYSTGVMAVMHSAQYLWITHYFQRREAAARAQTWRSLGYFSVLVLGGIALFVPGPWISSYVFHTDFRSSFLVFTALVNLHHFILDGAIWKLRDGRIASLLLSSQQSVAATANHASAWSSRLLRSRAFQATAALVLLAWGALDQARFVMLAHAGSTQLLKTAARLNPYDSAAQQRLAKAAIDSGDPSTALAAWERAAALAPADPAPRIEALRYLVAQNNLTEAYRLTSLWVRLAPRDPDLWVNHGILAQRFGNNGDARSAWERALQLDPHQRNAHLYLADLAEKEHHPADAIPQYAAYLQNIGESAPSDRPPAVSVVPIMLRLSQSLAATGKLPEAAKAAATARKIASNSHDPQLESLSATTEAEWRLKLGDATTATSLYQQAVRLDAQLKRPPLEALDWFNYALLLRQRGLPRQSYASLLKAQQLADPAAPEMKDIRTGLDDLAARSPQQIKGVKADLPAAVAEALAVK